MTVRLPARAGEVLAVMCAVAVGAALVTFCLVLGESGLRSQVPTERFAGIDMVVAGDQSVPQDEDFDPVLPEQVGVPADLAGDLREVQGVRAVAADLSFPAAVIDGRGRVLPVDSVRDNGHGWNSLLGTVDLNGDVPSGSADVVLAADAAARAGVSVGDAVEVLLRGQVRDMRVTGIADLAGGSVFVSDTSARELSRKPADTADLFTVVFDDDADAAAITGSIEELVAGRGFVVATGGDIGRAERPAVTSATGMLTAAALSVGGVVVVLVGFITAGAVSVGVANRSREIALLRAVGATPRQIRSMTAEQTTRAAFGAVIVGIIGGYVLAAAATRPLAAVGMLATGQTPSWSAGPALGAGLLMLGMVQVAARTGSLRISRMPGTEAILETEVEPRSGSSLRTRVGFVVLALSAGSAVVPLAIRSEDALIGTASGTLLAIIGVALIAPAMVGRVCGWVAPRTGSASGWLAVRNSGSNALRTGGTIGVLALAVGLLTTQIFAGTTASATVDHEVSEGAVADVLVSAPAAGGVSVSALAAIERAPSSTAAVAVIRSTALRPFQQDGGARAEEYPMLAVGPGVGQVLDLAVTDGNLSDLTGASVAMESAAARLAGVDVGDTLPLILSDGTEVEPTVVATYARGFGFGKIVASLDLLPQGPSGLYDEVLVAGDRAGITTELAPLLAGSPGLKLDDARTALAGPAAQDPSRVLNIGVSLVLMGYILLGVANRLVASTLRRRREWQLLRAVGATPRQLHTMAWSETALACLVATVIGLAISLGPMTILAIGFVGEPRPQGPLWPVVGTVLVTCAVAHLATTLPARYLLQGSGVPVPAG
ncbi:FtsX-like permease family protein [Rhodococcus sp. NPDC060086]|uniref:ABC transporter permease n=1 Tax=Rhodococcus sp. NPDC060086 TaxID=3347055 RepID=UPI003647426E